MAELSDRNLQELETLAGIRRQGDMSNAAVRVSDLDGLLQIPDALKSAKVGSSPTAGDFNKLFEDVQMLHTRLRAVVAALRRRRGR